VIRLPFIEEQSVKRLLVHERFLARLAGMRTRLNIPIYHRRREPRRARRSIRKAPLRRNPFEDGLSPDAQIGLDSPEVGFKSPEPTGKSLEPTSDSLEPTSDSLGILRILFRLNIRPTKLTFLPGNFFFSDLIRGRPDDVGRITRARALPNSDFKEQPGVYRARLLCSICGEVHRV